MDERKIMMAIIVCGFIQKEETFFNRDADLLYHYYGVNFSVIDIAKKIVEKL